jgi:hypothetical protein
MSFADFLNEKMFQVVTNNGLINYRLSYGHGKYAGLVAMASSSKELDKEIESGASKTEIGKDIQDSINNELDKRGQLFTVEVDYSYKGAGYGFNLNMEYLLKLLNK